MKLCRACGEEKPLTEFWARRDRGPVAVQSRCKRCTTIIGRAGRRKYRKSEKGKAAYARYMAGQGAITQSAKVARYKANGRMNEYHKRKREKRREFYLAIHAAHEALRRALLAGVVTRPGNCQRCGIQCKPDGHHHMGHAREHHLDVEWLCRKCHHHVDIRAHQPGVLAEWTGVGVGSER